jgi:hypothetical protein
MDTITKNSIELSKNLQIINKKILEKKMIYLINNYKLI